MVKNPPVYKGTPHLLSLNPYPPIYIAPSLLPTSHSSSCTLQQVSKERHLCLDALLSNRNMQYPYIHQHMVQKLKLTPLTTVQICLWKLSAARGCSLCSEKEIQREVGLSQGITQNQGTSHDTFPRALHLSFTFISS